MGLPEQDEALRLQWAMVLGWQTALTGEVAEPFMRSGTMHIFAIRLHIALIAGILVALFRSCALPRVWCGPDGDSTDLVLHGGDGLAGFGDSLDGDDERDHFELGAATARRSAEFARGAACIILVWDPLQLFQASFQLSFFVVLSIALLVPMLNSAKEKIFKLDPLLPLEVRPTWQRTAIRSGNFVWTAVATSIAAFLRFRAAHRVLFSSVHSGSLLANLLVVPASSLALMSGLGAIITGEWLPFATELFNHSGWWWMKMMVWLSQSAAATRGSWWFVSAAHLRSRFLFYYTALLALLTGALFAAPWRWWLASLLAGLAVLWSAQWNHERSQHLLTVLPLNGGHAVFSKGARDSSQWLLDCGDDSAVDFVMKPFLQAQGVNRLPSFLLTCGNADQMGGAIALNKLFKVERVFASPAPLRSMKYREALSTFEVTSQAEPPCDEWSEVGILERATPGRSRTGSHARMIIQCS
jgi:predicted membrane metal-binding protein